MKTLARWSICSIVMLVISGCLMENADKKEVAQVKNRIALSIDSTYQKYTFSRRDKKSFDLILKIDRNQNGDFTGLHIMDLRKEDPVDSFWLEDRGNVARGESYVGQGGFYDILHDKNNNITEVNFTEFARERGQEVTWRGTGNEKISSGEWIRMSARRRATTSQRDYDPPRLPSRLGRWVDNNFGNVARKKEQNRGITIGGRYYYGAVYEIQVGDCAQQIWGLDDADVIRFFEKKRFTISRASNTRAPTMECDNPMEISFMCDRDQIKDQLVLRIEDGNLIGTNMDGSTWHINRYGECHNGRP